MVRCRTAFAATRPLISLRLMGPSALSKHGRNGLALLRASSTREASSSERPLLAAVRPGRWVKLRKLHRGEGMLRA